MVLIVCLLLGLLLGGLLLLLLVVGSLLGRLGGCELVEALRLVVRVLVCVLGVGVVISRHRGRVRVGSIGGFVIAHVVVDGGPGVVVMGLGVTGILSKNNVETADGSSNGCGHPA